MSHPSAVPGPQPVQIPERAHAVAPDWRQVLDRLHEQVHAIAPGYHLVDLTEKLGGLRLQVEDPGGDINTLSPLIAAAPAESMSVCEFCGAPGRVRTRNDDPYGWRKSVCPGAERGYGIADLAAAHASDTPHRADGCLAYHVLEAMEALLAAAEAGQPVHITSTPVRPAAVPAHAGRAFAAHTSR